MTLKEVLNLMDHEVWVRVRPHVRGPTDETILPDVVIWSADWIGGGVDDPLIPKELKDYLDWDADDLSIEYRPTGRQKPTPMIVVNAYDYAQEPPTIYVLVKLGDYGAGAGAPKCRVFLDERYAEAAMRDDYDAEIDSRDCDVDEKGSYVTSVDAALRFSNGVKIEWAIYTRTAEDNDYR